MPRPNNELKWAILTVMAVLALAYVMNQSGQTSTLGALLAGTGAFFAALPPILGKMVSPQNLAIAATASAWPAKRARSSARYSAGACCCSCA